MLKLLVDNRIYRVSDLFFRERSDALVLELLQSPDYEGTLLRQYFEKFNGYQGVHSYEDFYNILVENKDKYDLPELDKYIVVHIRSGDAYKTRGLGNPENYGGLLREIKKKDYRPVMIVTALHYDSSREKTSMNEESIIKNKELIESFVKKLMDYDVYLCSNSNPDVDLMFMTFCDCLVTTPSSGGFSRMAAKLNEINRSKKNF